ncbi:pyridoxamine 5'-phosphate oxidase family protein [Thiothrix nivea]|uniref:pyridoxamine 5'-phosphate oxidase family protein n=1 Tax=Thiothrix nivea TaxID=1031 RepID=UPI0009D9C32C|nr:pyridoxamine 5'-phosphate oxidase family protein [Thiothrix nivea]
MQLKTIEHDVFKLAKNLLERNRLGVLSTIAKDLSVQSAVVGYAECSDFSIIFGSDISSRKYNNLTKVPRVSFVIWEGNETLQYEGNASIIDRETDEVNIHAQKHISFEKYKHIKTNIYYKITPLWMRYSDFSTKPELVLSYSFK